MDPQHIFDQNWSSRFEWQEYLVFSVLLALSLGIGVYYGFFDKKNKTNEDFVLAGRSMPVFPVAVSSICSFVSAVTLLGSPVETYLFGLQYLTNVIGYIFLGLALAYLYIPVYFQLRLTSIYEYFEMRFDRKLRVVISLSQIFYTIIYMPLAVYGPSIALEEVAGIDKLWTSGVIFVVCILYSSIGGLKCVLWTDVLQSMVMLASIISVLIVGVIEVGGFDVIWKRSEQTGRTKLFNFDVDPRTRHTFWTGMFGGYFNRIASFAATQTYVQRYLSVPDLHKARQVVWITVAGLTVILLLTSLTGVVIFANYFDCDPITLNAISSSDELLPLFVMDKLGDFPLLPGLFVAGLTAGSLSTVSSLLNSVAAVITQDYIKEFRPNLDQVQLGYASKISSVVAGIISFVLIFAIEKAGNILPFATLLIGAFVGPTFGAFTLGMWFPWSNSLGVLLGLVPSLVVTLFIGIGSIMAGNEKKLPNQRFPLFKHGCYNFTGNNSTDFLEDFSSLPMVDFSQRNDAWKDGDDSALIKVLSLSYIWQSTVPIVSTTFFGLLFSFIVIYFKSESQARSKEKYFSAPLLKLWEYVLGKPSVAKYVEYEDEEISKHPLKS